jgi:hypothetical protein
MGLAATEKAPAVMAATARETACFLFITVLDGRKWVD